MCGLFSFIIVSKSDHNLSQLCALLKLLTSSVQTAAATVQVICSTSKQMICISHFTYLRILSATNI